MTILPAYLYDGQSATRHDVQVRLSPDLLEIVDQEAIAWPALRRESNTPNVLHHVDRAGWRLVLNAMPTGQEADWLPRVQRYGGIFDRMGLVAGVVASLALVLGLFFAARSSTYAIARLIPMQWEASIAGFEDFGFTDSKQCTANPAGQRALDALAARLSTGKYPLTVQVVDVPMVNAVALPGGRVLIFRQLLDDARSPDEVAGVLGHEIGHVEHRHVMASIIQEFGLSILMGGQTQSSAITGWLISNGFSRSAEADADQFAIDRLHANNISPLGTAAFFDVLTKDEGEIGRDSTLGKIASYASTHPLSKARAEAYRASAKETPHPHPAMTGAEWQALKAICKKK